MTTNFVPDTHTLKLTDYSERGKGSTNMKFDLAQKHHGRAYLRVPRGHLQERPSPWPRRPCDHSLRPGLFGVVARWRSPSASIGGRAASSCRRINGSISISIPAPTPARYLALRWNNWRYRFMRSQDGEGGTYTSFKLGGNQIEFEDEDPQIHKDFEAAMKAAGAQVQHALSSGVHAEVVAPRDYFCSKVQAFKSSRFGTRNGAPTLNP